MRQKIRRKTSSGLALSRDVNPVPASCVARDLATAPSSLVVQAVISS